MANTNRAGASDQKRKTITIILIIGIVIFLIWQVSDMLGSGSGSTEIASAPSQTNGASGGESGSTPDLKNPQPQIKQPQQVAQKLPMSEREAELLRLQQQTQVKYIEAVNQLQMLKLSLQIAETNKSIMAAKLATIKDQKDIVEILEPPKKSIVADYSVPALHNAQPSQQAAQGDASSSPTTGNQEVLAPAPRPIEQMAAQTDQSSAASATSQKIEPSIPYTVVSVSKINDRWSAVIGVQGALFSIHVGDIIPADGSKVMNINSRGIVLERNGRERKVSLVPII